MSHSLAKLFHEFYSPLCNYAASFIGDKYIAEDLVQAVFLQLFENKKFLHLDNPEPYLLRCVKYKSIDHLRCLKNRKEVSFEILPDLVSPEETVLTEEDIVPLLTFFAAKLPPKMQKVFLLSRKEGMTYRQISDQMGISVKPVENQMVSALKKLRKLLKDHQYLSLALTLIKNIFT